MKLIKQVAGQKKNGQKRGGWQKKMDEGLFFRIRSTQKKSKAD